MYKTVYTIAIALGILLSLSCGGSEDRAPESPATPDLTVGESNPIPASISEKLAPESLATPDSAAGKATPDASNITEVADGSTPGAVAETALRPPQPLPNVSGHVSEPPFPDSLEQQIISADIVVLASFLSASAGTETIPGPVGEQPTYRPVLTLTFSATEYLKGTGPDEFAVEMRSVGYENFIYDGQRYRGYLTEAEALA